MPEDPSVPATPPAEIPTPTPETTPATTPTPAPAAEEKPNPVKQLRDALDTEKQRAKDLEAKVKQFEMEKLSETERLQATIKELEPLRDEHGKFASTLEKLYNAELASVPEDKQEQVKTLSSVGSWADKLEAIRAAKALIPAPAAPAPPAPAGTVTNPSQRKPADAPLTLAEIKNMKPAEVAARWAEVEKVLAGK